MIHSITGKVRAKKQNSLIVDVNGISYEILLPGIVMRYIETAMDPEGMVSLVTYHYYQVTPSQSIPVLIGFANEVEKEFFEKFITVSGVGPKAACRALEMPFSAIVQAIDSGDIATLKQLPGIGEQRAREIIAKLQGKVGKFGLIRDKAEAKKTGIAEDALGEALEVLLQLQYKRNEAHEMLKKALERNPSMSTSEEILDEVYKQRHRR